MCFCVNKKNTSFLYQLKTSENLMVFWYFEGLEKDWLGKNGLTRHISSIQACCITLKRNLAHSLFSQSGRFFWKFFYKTHLGDGFLKSTLLYSGNNCSILRAYLWTISSICSSTCYIFVLVIKVFFNSISLLKNFRNIF